MLAFGHFLPLITVYFGFMSMFLDDVHIKMFFRSHMLRFKRECGINYKKRENVLKNQVNLVKCNNVLNRLMISQIVSKV